MEEKSSDAKDAEKPQTGLKRKMGNGIRNGIRCGLALAVCLGIIFAFAGLEQLF